MAHWPEPQFDPPLPPFSYSFVGAWFAQFEVDLELNHMDPGVQYAVLLDFVPLAHQLHLGVLSPGLRPYDELRQSVLNFYGAAYRPLSEVDGMVCDSVPTPSRPAPDASPSTPVSHHQARFPSSTCPKIVSSTTRCATAQSPASGSLQWSLSWEYAHNGATKGIDMTTIPATSSPCSAPTMTRDLPLGLSSDYSDMSGVGGWEQSSRHTNTADGLAPPSLDASVDVVSHPPPDPVLRVVPTLELANQHDPAAASSALPDFRQPAPVPSLNVARRRLPRRLERHSTPTPLTAATPRLRQARAGLGSLDSGGVARRGLHLMKSTAGRARPEKRVRKLHLPQLTHL